MCCHWCIVCTHLLSSLFYSILFSSLLSFWKNIKRHSFTSVFSLYTIKLVLSSNSLCLYFSSLPLILSSIKSRTYSEGLPSKANLHIPPLSFCLRRVYLNQTLVHIHLGLFYCYSANVVIVLYNSTFERSWVLGLLGKITQINALYRRLAKELSFCVRAALFIFFPLPAFSCS